MFSAKFKNIFNLIETIAKLQENKPAYYVGGDLICNLLGITRDTLSFWLSPLIKKDLILVHNGCYRIKSDCYLSEIVEVLTNKNDRKNPLYLSLYKSLQVSPLDFFNS